MIKAKTLLENYKILHTIGQGSYAEVKVALHTTLQKKVAIKIISKTSKNPKNPLAYKNEIKIMHNLLHENIIQFYETFQDEKNLYIIMEYASKGDFLDLVSKKKILSEKEALFYFRQIINGLHYLHSQKIAHLDLKLENLLFINNSVKITDFGFSCFLQNGEFLSKFCGTLRYTAPEILRNIGYSGELADIWSVGVILFILVSGKCPFEDDCVFEILKKMRKREIFFPEFLSEDVKDLILKMLEPDVGRRIGVWGVMSHRWFLRGDFGGMVYMGMKNAKINQFRLIPGNFNKVIFRELAAVYDFKDFENFEQLAKNYDFGNFENFKNFGKNYYFGCFKDFGDMVIYGKKGSMGDWMSSYRILYCFFNFRNKSGGKSHPFLMKEFERKKKLGFDLKEIEEFFNFFFIELESNHFWKFGYELNFGFKSIFKFLVDVFNFFKIKIYCVDRDKFFYKGVKRNKNSREIFFFRFFNDYDSIVVDVQNFNMRQINFFLLLHKIDLKIKNIYKIF